MGDVSNDRIMTLDGSSSSATAVDDIHNLKGDPYRIVSSDGVLLCVSKKILIQSDVLSNMVDSGTPSEICLTDTDIENAQTVRLLLDLLCGKFEGFKEKAGVACDTLLLADKYGFDLAKAITVHFLQGDVDFDATLAVRVFCVASMLDLEDLAAKAAKVLLEQPTLWNSTKVNISHSRLNQTPPTYVWALARAYAAKCANPPASASTSTVTLSTSCQWCKQPTLAARNGVTLSCVKCNSSQSVYATPTTPTVSANVPFLSCLKSTKAIVKKAG